MNHQNTLTLADINAGFSRHGKYHNGPWAAQDRMHTFVVTNGSSLIESPTGSGKTAVENAIAMAAARKFNGPVFIITPNKTILQQISQEFPELKIVYGQIEYPCPWAFENFEEAPARRVTLAQLPLLDDDENIPRVSEVPHMLHRQCPHYVDQTTGETKEPGVVPCPYYYKKYEALQPGNVVLCTMSFYLFWRLFGPGASTEPVTLVIDEVHRIADVVRSSLSFDITDWHLQQAIELLERLEDEAADEVKVLKAFLKKLRSIAKAHRRQPNEETLLTDEEIQLLIVILEDIDPGALMRKIERAVRAGLIDIQQEWETLKKLETLVKDIRRYIHSLEYSLPGEQRTSPDVVKRGGPLNYTCAFYREELGDNQRVQYKLVIQCHYVAPLIKKRLLSPLTVSMSATIGDPKVFGYETGITHPFLELGSNFPPDNTRLYIPKDALNLAHDARSRQDLTKTLRRIARACVRFARQGLRSLVVVISNAERDKFLMLAGEERLEAISYGNGVTAKDAALAFREGLGQTLVGTAANYSEGVDLPRQTAPIIFFLRPGYPNHRDASSQFEKRKLGNGQWALWNWRVMQQALQVRGRNVRSRSDFGVTFFMSAQFRRFLYHALPDWLKPAYRKDFTLEQAIVDAENLLLPHLASA